MNHEADRYIRIKQELSAKSADLVDIKTDYLEAKRKVVKKIEKKALPMSESLIKRITEVRNDLKKYFFGLGIEDKELNEDQIYLLPAELNRFGHSTSFYTVIFDLGIDNIVVDKSGNINIFDGELLKEMILSARAAHEMYHQMAKTSFIMTYQHGELRGAKDTRSGLLYTEAITNHNEEDFLAGSALEEGLANFVERKLFNEKIKPKYPSEIQDFYDMCMKKLIAYFKDKKEGVTAHSIIIRAIKNTGELNFTTRGCHDDCLRLVEFLSEIIPDFFKLAEQARIQNKTISLARTIESKFGGGSYRKIVTTPAIKANELLRQLQDRQK